MLGKKAVDLVKLIGDPILLIKGHASPGVTQRDGEMSVPRGRGDAHLASVCELDGIANEVEQHCVILRRCLSPMPTRSDLSGRRQHKPLYWASDSVAARTDSTQLSMAYSVMFRVNCAEPILVRS